MALFSFDTSRGETPQSVARKRALAEAIMGRSMTPQNVGEGFGAIADGLVANVMGQRADAAEQAGTASAQDAFASGFEPVIPREATNSNRPHLAEASLEDIDRYMGRVVSLEDAIGMLS